MTPGEVHSAIASGAVILDMRPPRPFALEHVAGAVNFQFNRADLADRADLALPRGPTFIVHAEPEPIAKVAVELLREAGFAVAGHLQGGLAAWKNEGLPTEVLPLLDVDRLHREADAFRVLDVRESYEFRFGHIPRAELLVWTEAWDQVGGVSADRPLAVLCGDQVRSAFVASLLQRAGKPAHLVFGGMADWLERGFVVEKS